MPTYRYTVEVECASKDEADTVIAERVYYDEDYGFDYTISATTQPAVNAEEKP